MRSGLFRAALYSNVFARGRWRSNWPCITSPQNVTNSWWVPVSWGRILSRNVPSCWSTSSQRAGFIGPLQVASSSPTTQRQAAGCIGTGWNRTLKKVNALHRNPSQSYGASLAIWDHTMLPATRHKWTRPTITRANQAGTRFTYPAGMEGWVS